MIKNIISKLNRGAQRQSGGDLSRQFQSVKEILVK